MRLITRTIDACRGASYTANNIPATPLDPSGQSAFWAGFLFFKSFLKAVDICQHIGYILVSKPTEPLNFGLIPVGLPFYTLSRPAAPLSKDMRNPAGVPFSGGAYAV